MANSRVNTLDQNFITCQICFSEFNGETRKPKFLPCCHTICLECFQTLRRGNTILCPFCRTHTRFNDNSNGVEWVLPTNHYVLELLRLNETDFYYDVNSMPSTAPVEPAEEVDVQFALAQATQEQQVILPTVAAISQPTHEHDQLSQLRLSLEISGREIEVEILNEARRQSLSNQQQSPTLRDVDGHREPQGNTEVVPSTQHTTTVPNTTSDDEDQDDFSNEDIFLMFLLGYYVL
ncbi:E3 ubiquitin-protein ligase RNF152-like isoform X2 [Daphnia pulicaria]|uniref:E3 ubiquitin-protein ligase RNF152-like isoform X2 n=1 Tax=Daphnia pulicaria TaxID=35523 RepID=UPI001EEACCE6|nr:E3 ubiquitin-protein ligase RNF152-like isoform X2 [Daphnia pulicaria]